MVFYCDFMYASSVAAGNWNFRIFGKRLIVIKTINESVRKAAVLDVATSLTFAVEVPDAASMRGLSLEKEYVANLKVYTSKNVEGVDADFADFFEALDIDQDMEDFIKAYWIYPDKIRFELVEIEEPGL